MPTWTLSIRDAGEPQRQAVAWFIPGGQVADWWEELLSWGRAGDDLQLLVLPHSASDRLPRGLLAIGPQPESLRVSLRCRPYGCIGRRFYLPVEATLEPLLNAAELDGLLPPAHRIFVFHPATGLVGLEPHECLRLGQLLKATRPQPADWDPHGLGPTLMNNCCPSVRTSCHPSNRSCKLVVTVSARVLPRLFEQTDAESDSVTDGDSIATVPLRRRRSQQLGTSLDDGK